MATVIQKSGYVDAYDLRIKTQWRDSFGEAEPEFEKFYIKDETTYQDERYSSQTGFGLWAQTGENEPFNMDTVYEGYSSTLTPYQWTSGFEISEIAWEDDHSGLLGEGLATAHAESARDTLEYLGALPYNNATSTTGFSPWKSGGDGKALLATDHPLPAGGSYGNTPAVAIDISVAALQTGITSMEKTQNGRGFIRRQTPKKLIIPTASKFLARQILYPGGLPFSTDNTRNALGDEDLQIETWSQLGASRWFLQAAPASKPGQKGHNLIYMVRISPQFDRDNRFTTGARQYKGRFRIGFIDRDWRGLYGSIV